MIARALCQALLLFTISSAFPLLEGSAAAEVHSVQGRRPHHHRRQHEHRRAHHHARARAHAGEL